MFTGRFFFTIGARDGLTNASKRRSGEMPPNSLVYARVCSSVVSPMGVARYLDSSSICISVP